MNSSRTRQQILAGNNVNVRGRGERAIVFAHGFGCDQSAWRMVAPAFEGDYRVVLFDYTGCGDSDLSGYDAEKYCTLDGYATDLLDVCTALDLHNSIFVGHSVSSTIGLLAAIKSGDKNVFSTVIMIAPCVSFLNDDTYCGGFERKDIDELMAMMDADYQGWAATVGPVFMGYPDRPALGHELADGLADMDPDISRRFARVAFYADHRTELGKMHIPCLILQCADDPLVPLKAAEYIHQHLPDSTLAVLRAQGHCPHMSEPREVVQEMRRYLGSVL